MDMRGSAQHIVVAFQHSYRVNLLFYIFLLSLFIEGAGDQERI
jgi:hypothetical protein